MSHRPPNQKPTVTVGKDGATELSHPAFGRLSITKSSGSQALFGVDASSTYSSVLLRVHHAQQVLKTREGTARAYTHGPAVLEVEMSPAQFADLITSMGSFEGVPCTIRIRDGQIVPGIVESETDLTASTKAVRAAGSEIVEAVTVAKERVLGAFTGKLSQKALTEIEGAFTILRREVQEHLPHLVSVFEEAITASAARTQVNLQEAIRAHVERVGDSVVRSALEGIPLQPRLGVRDDSDGS